MTELKVENIERLLILLEKYDASRKVLKSELKAEGKDQIDLAKIDLYNPDRDNIFDFINGLTQTEKNIIMALMKFGQLYSNPSEEDLEFCLKTSFLDGEHDIEYMLGKPLGKFLKNALRKLELIKLRN